MLLNWLTLESFLIWDHLYEQKANPQNMALPKAKADNTVRECKNQYMMTYLRLLVAQLRTVAMAFLRKSHTHCRVGVWVSRIVFYYLFCWEPFRWVQLYFAPLPSQLRPIVGDHLQKDRK